MKKILITRWDNDGFWTKEYAPEITNITTIQTRVDYIRKLLTEFKKHGDIKGFKVEVVTVQNA